MEFPISASHSIKKIQNHGPLTCLCSGCAHNERRGQRDGELAILRSNQWRTAATNATTLRCFRKESIIEGGARRCDAGAELLLRSFVDGDEFGAYRNAVFDLDVKNGFERF